MKIILKLHESLNRSNSILSQKYLHQFLATIAVNIIAFSHGIVIGWLSPTLHQLRSTHSPLDFPVSIKEASWIGSLLGIGSLSGIVIFGFLVDRIGRKICIYLMALPHIGIWLCIYFAQSVEILYIGRFIGGITGGGTILLLPLYVSEIADTRIRGRLSTLFMFALNLGMLLGFIIASRLSYHTMPIAMIALPLIYLISCIFIPETPQYLLRKNKTLAAEKAFNFYKNCYIDKSTNNEIQQCQKEFIELQNNLVQNSNKNNLSYKDFVTKTSLKAFLTAAVILFLNQFSGNFAFMNYMSLIFVETGSVLEPNESTILMGVIALIGIQLATLLVDRCGRKMLMLISAGMVCLLQLAFGAFVYFSTKQILLNFNWVPVVLMSCILLFTFIGYGAISFVLIVEIFPVKIRSTGTVIVSMGMSCCIFISLKIFPLLMETYGISITMWMCASVCLFSFIYLAIFLPETKNKSMDTE